MEANSVKTCTTACRFQIFQGGRGCTFHLYRFVMALVRVLIDSKRHKHVELMILLLNNLTYLCGKDYDVVKLFESVNYN